MDIPLFILSSCPTPYMFPFFSLYFHCHGLTFTKCQTYGWCCNVHLLLRALPYHHTTLHDDDLADDDGEDVVIANDVVKPKTSRAPRKRTEALYGDVLKDFVVTSKWVGKKTAEWLMCFPSCYFLLSGMVRIRFFRIPAFLMKQTRTSTKTSLLVTRKVLMKCPASKQYCKGRRSRVQE